MAFWLMLVYYLGVPICDGWDVLILLLPIIVFLVAINNINAPLHGETHQFIFRNNYYSSVSIILFPIILWCASKVDHNPEFLLIVIVATIFAMLTFLDWWIHDEQYVYVKHFRTIVQTFSIVLMIFALKMFYADRIIGLRLRCNGIGQPVETDCDMDEIVPNIL